MLPVRRIFSLQSPLLAPLLLAGLTLLFFHKLAFSGMILARGDVYTYFYPYWAARSGAFLNGLFPLWSPDIFMGVPLLANSQLGTFYPPNWLVTTLAPPTAITVSLLAHIFWAMLGVYILTRRALNLDQIPALVASVLFGLGGYLGGQVEHINQLQALSWLPWAFYLFHQSLRESRPENRLPNILLLGTALALQLFAGHPQTVFITLVGLGVYGLALIASRQNMTYRAGIFRLIVCFLLATVLMLILASPQWIPTLELAGQSNRSGGLNQQQAMAFSFSPFLIGRGLLPSYDGLLFGEYIAYSGVIGLALAVIGIFSRHVSLNFCGSNRFSTLPYILLAVVAFSFSLGVYNPLYWLLAQLPGFSFFRVPARWLALVALAAAVLAGVGLQSLQIARPRWWVYIIIVFAIIGLAASSLLSDRMASEVIGSATPTIRTWLGWITALIVALIIVRYVSVRWRVSLLALTAVAELLLASQILTYNELAPPDTYSASRFTVRQLQVYAAEQTPPGRLLSITPLEFDPGDVESLKTRYTASGMSDLAIRIALVDTKMREVLAPNLALAWGFPSIDGFDGGLLPTDHYSQFTSLMLPPGESPTVDGRLREMLSQPECRGACIPDQRWLNLTNTRYLITDKTADIAHNGVFYDTTFETEFLAGQDLTLSELPTFEATALDLLYTCATNSCSPPVLTLLDDLVLKAPELTPLDNFYLARFSLLAPTTLLTLTFHAEDAFNLRAVTLVDTRTGDFQSVDFTLWKRVLSSDIKLYENSQTLPRAFIAHDIRVAQDDQVALTTMRAASFDPAQSAVIVANGEIPPISVNRSDTTASATITDYTSERIEIAVTTTSPDNLLVLTDPDYPGWTVTVNGEPAAIERTDIMFRGVMLPQGQSTLVFEYRPWWWPGILIVGAVAWGLLILLLVIVVRRARIKSEYPE